MSRPRHILENNINLDALAEFVHALRRQGMVIGTEHFAQIQELLLALAAHKQLPETPEQLKRWLRPVLCSQAEDSETYDRLFDEWSGRIFSQYNQEEKPDPDPAPIPIKLRQLTAARRGIQVVVILLLFGLIYWVAATSNPDEIDKLPDSDANSTTVNNGTLPSDFTPGNAADTLITEESVQDVLSPAIDKRFLQTMAISGNQSRGANALQDGSIEILDIFNDSLRRSGLLAGTSPITSIQFLADSDRLVTASEDSILRVWDVPAESLLTETSLPHIASRLAWNPGTRHLATGGHDGTIAHWSYNPNDHFITTRRPMPIQATRIARIQFESFTRDLALTPDGRLISLPPHPPAPFDSPGHLIATIDHQNWVFHAAFSPDGNRAITASAR